MISNGPAARRVRGWRGAAFVAAVGLVLWLLPGLASAGPGILAQIQPGTFDTGGVPDSGSFGLRTRPADEYTSPAAALSPLAMAFDRDRAWNDLVRQVDFGPRIPGTIGHEKTMAYIIRELMRAGWEVEIKRLGPVPVTMLDRDVLVQNIIARWKPERERKIYFAAHYDTRHISDMGETPEERATPIPGANDGGSGVAALLEMARAITRQPPENVGVIMVFHDLEDFGVPPGTQSWDRRFFEWALGAQLQVQVWEERDAFEAGLNLDMVAGRRMVLRKEGHSIQYQPDLVEEVWKIGKRHWPNVFIDARLSPVLDDHLPYLVVGKPVINLIDMAYEEWHTPYDLPEACSPQSLYIAGTTALEFLFHRDRISQEKP